MTRPDGPPFERRYHHLGVVNRDPRPDEIYLDAFKLHCTDENAHPLRVQWMRYEPDCPLPELVRTRPHVAYEVDDLDAALDGCDVLIEANSPSPGVRVAFIVESGAPVELLQFFERRDESPRAPLEIHRWSHGPMGGPPLHVHLEDAEAWHVLDGTLRFRFADEVVEAAAGDTVTAPAGMPHTYGSDGEVTYLILGPPRIFALIKALHEPHDDAAAIYRRYASEVLE